MTWAVIHFEPKPDDDDEQAGDWQIDFVGTQIGAREAMAEILRARDGEVEPLLFKDHL